MKNNFKKYIIIFFWLYLLGHIAILLSCMLKNQIYNFKQTNYILFIISIFFFIFIKTII